MTLLHPADIPEWLRLIRARRDKVTDSWAQRPDNGVQGLDSVEYEDSDDASLAWIHETRVAAMIDACPYDVRESDGRYYVGVALTDADDDVEADKIVASVKAAIGPGWSVAWTGNGNGDESDLAIEWSGDAS